MILDTQALFSDDQAITTTAASTNIIELPPRSNYGNPMRILVLVTTTFAGGTSIAIDVETDTTAAFPSATKIYTGTAIVTATLVQGYKFNIDFMPRNNENFVRLKYTVVGTMTAGAITAGIILDEQTNGLVDLPPAP